MTSALLLLAAGGSRRFGPENKLLAPLRGRALLRHAADAARRVGATRHLAVVSDAAVAAELADFEQVLVAPGGPMSDSLRAGVAVAAAKGATRVLIVLADMPRVPTSLMQAVLDAPALPAAASDGARLCPPVCLPASLFAAVAALRGDQGAAALLGGLPAAQRIAAPAGALVDVDQPADLEGLG